MEHLKHQQLGQNEGNKVKVEDIKVFGDLLSYSRAKIDKTVKQIAEELNMNPSAIINWENDGKFPEEGRLPQIAEAYAIDLDKLKNAFSISKEAREMEKQRNLRINVKTSTTKKGDRFDFGIPNSGRVQPKPSLDREKEL
jgi:transcriptional regulator with XRE-family HTH domain